MMNPSVIDHLKKKWSMSPDRPVRRRRRPNFFINEEAVERNCSKKKDKKRERKVKKKRPIKIPDALSDSGSDVSITKCQRKHLQRKHIKESKQMGLLRDLENDERIRSKYFVASDYDED